MGCACLPHYLEKQDLSALDDALAGVRLSQYRTTDGRQLELYWLGAQASPKLVLLPPYGMSYLLLSRLAQRLARHFHVLCWESIGCPNTQTSLTAEDFDLDRQAATLLGILHQHDYADCHFVGWCQAAQLAVHAIALHGFAPRSMAWVAPAGLLPPIVKSEFERCALPIYLQIERHGLEQAKKLAAILDKYRGQPLSGDDLAEKLTMLHLADPASTLVFSRYMRAYEENKQSVQALLPAALGRHPTLIVHCKDDSFSHYSASVQLARHDPSLRLDLLDHGGHLQLFNDPGAVAQRIIDFIGLTVGEVAPTSMHSAAPDPHVHS
ncbi:alpha/beta hydrolase [Xanthomonas sp. MUS 060]|uniref:alpha/beta fold hydrolase n=1 Tax=Xanthomonas sp. MUS 060 TaxID=1588031 RepID=UPI0005F2F32D|nr:alpha/beta hydrolase [Xanthomonas sp. MUS 060]